jgi:hypothetical protein
MSLILHVICPTGVDALFEFYVDGDAGVDPNAMTLWFTQPTLGLPSKVHCMGISLFLLCPHHSSGILQGTRRAQRLSRCH